MPVDFEAVPDGLCSIKIKGSNDVSVNVYSFPSNVQIHQLINGEFVSFPIHYPTSEVILKVQEKKSNLFIAPGDSIIINVDDSKISIEKSNFRIVNQYYVSAPINATEFSRIHSLSFDEAQIIADSLFFEEIAALEKHKYLPEWFSEYEKSRIKSKIFFPLVDVARKSLPASAFKEFFENEFAFTNPFNAYQYSNYTSIMIYLESFNSEELNNEIKDAGTWMVGVEERSLQTMTHLPFEFQDINLANQLKLRLDAGIITRNNLSDYFDMFTNKNWYTILENQLPAESEMLTEGEKLPYFFLPSISGQFFDSNDLVGKYSYVNFWSFWCKPCLEKFPKENELAERHQGINYINICLDADSTRWIEFSKENISKQTINLWANDNWSRILKEKFNIMTLPKSTLSDKKGHVFIKTPPLSKTYLDSLFSSI